MTDAKKLLKGAVLLAVAKPPVGVKLDPPAGILLYGPPGTGKTMLAKAASNMLGASFFNLPGGEIENKWYGESSKIVKRVFEEARVKSPSIVFLDEIDTLVGKRDAGSERDPSKSILGTLLTEMEGATTSKGKNPPMVLVLAGTNQPMNLDPAFLTRFNRRVMIPLPDENARSAILAKQITARGLSLEVPLESIVARTEGYSGRELRNLAQEMIRLMVEECNTDLYERVGKENLAESSYKVGPITHAHVERALHDVRAVTSHEAIVRLEEWARGGIS
ncbi:MAG: ATP-binding protein [Euryarchaeota archaeon]|nr:ATP-binding protein [Euryarchaeota archaeon]